ncbi:hypothetical protein [Granulicella sibirica]|uniref:hypothetical protein n=1 Tax=Granulicella sibirica TaxID=2479048 RepID=UPI001008E8AE|nr:hypothetical protein [Granulicella sibirica]
MPDEAQHQGGSGKLLLTGGCDMATEKALPIPAKVEARVSALSSKSPSSSPVQQHKPAPASHPM